MSHLAALLLALVYVGVMWREEGWQSAALLSLPLVVLVGLIRNAEAVADYTGWAGRVPITRRSNAAAVRALAWAALLAPMAVCLWRNLASLLA